MYVLDYDYIGKTLLPRAPGGVHSCVKRRSFARPHLSQQRSRFGLRVPVRVEIMSGSGLMRAIRVSEFGAPSVLQVCSGVGIPHPGPRQVTAALHTRDYAYLRRPEPRLSFFFFFFF